MAVSLLSRHVTALLTCAKEGSFSKAAGKMYISPTALIAQIDLFESRLGFKLFERSPRGLKLTPQGQSLFEDAKRLTEESANAIRRAYLQGLEDNSINIGTSPVVPGQYAVFLWQKLKNHLNGSSIRLIPFENKESVAYHILAHLGEEIDLVPGLYDESFLKRHHCQALFMEDGHMGIAIPDNLELKSKESLSSEDLEGYEVLMPGPNLCELYDNCKLFLQQNFPQLKFLDLPFRSLEAYNDAYTKGQLVFTLMQWANDHPLFRTLRFNIPLKGTFGLIHSSEPRAVVQNFLTAATKLRDGLI